MDPLGFGLENFDAIGAGATTTTPAARIDATGELPGGHISVRRTDSSKSSPRGKDDFCHNLTGKLLAYALCRQVEGYDDVVVDHLHRRLSRKTAIACRGSSSES